jgi:hypothetical protein
MDRVVTDEMVRALEAEPGFAGALNLVDCTSGDAMMIILPRSPPAPAGRSPCGRSTRGRKR